MSNELTTRDGTVAVLSYRYVNARSRAAHITMHESQSSEPRVEMSEMMRHGRTKSETQKLWTVEGRAWAAAQHCCFCCYSKLPKPKTNPAHARPVAPCTHTHTQRGAAPTCSIGDVPPQSLDLFPCGARVSHHAHRQAQKRKHLANPVGAAARQEGQKQGGGERGLGGRPREYLTWSRRLQHVMCGCSTQEHPKCVCQCHSVSV